MKVKPIPSCRARCKKLVQRKTSKWRYMLAKPTPQTTPGRTPVKKKSVLSTPTSRSTKKRSKVTPLQNTKQDVSSARNLFETTENHASEDSMLELEELDESILMSEETSDDKQYQSELSQLQDMLPTILKEFKSAGLEKYYIKFNNLVHSGQFDFANIAFLLFCDVVQFLSLESTTQMRYDIPATRKFWYLSHLLF